MKWISFTKIEHKKNTGMKDEKKHLFSKSFQNSLQKRIQSHQKWLLLIIISKKKSTVTRLSVSIGFDAYPSRSLLDIYNTWTLKIQNFLLAFFCKKLLSTSLYMEKEEIYFIERNICLDKLSDEMHT